MGVPPPAPNRPDPVPAPVLEPGAIFAERYEILRRIGTGGMGTVYLARHRAMGRLCALKLLHPSLGRDREARDRFTREARNACRIAHPNVCTVYDFGATPEGQLFLVLEYVDGRSLGAILAEVGALPFRRAVELTGAIAAGLDAAHELGIVHRDLKPDNVMVAESRGGGRETVKLVDFGIAKAIEPELPGAVTEAGVVVGTPEYMAPEQFTRDAVDHRSDVYALGMVFYRMVAGTLPFRASSVRESLARRLTERPEPLAGIAPGRRFPRRLQLAVDSALSRDPRERFPSAGAFAAAVRAAIADLPADVGDQVPTVRLDARTGVVVASGPATRRWRTGWRAGALVTIGLGGAAAVALLTSGPRASPTDAPVQSENAVAPPPSGTATTDTVGGTGQRSATRSPPSPRPGGTKSATPIPALPDPGKIGDPETRGADSAIALQIYGRPDADPAIRAKAAYYIATWFVFDGRSCAAIAWADSASRLNDRALSDRERESRRKRYQDFLLQWRPKCQESPTT